MDSGTYVIAGGSSGIGLELVKMLAPTAARIDVWSRETHQLDTSGVVRHAVCDFGIPDGPLPEAPEEICGAVYCPGTITLRSFRSLATADFRHDLEVNLIGAVRFLQACQPRLRGQGGSPASVVLFSTVAVGQGMPMHASVAAAKGAVEGLVRSLAAEWAPKIRVNAIVPGWTRAAMTESLLDSPAAQAKILPRVPLRRWGTPQDFEAVAVWLASSGSSYFTGQTLVIDGGYTVF